MNRKSVLIVFWVGWSHIFTIRKTSQAIWRFHLTRADTSLVDTLHSAPFSLRRTVRLPSLVLRALIYFTRVILFFCVSAGLLTLKPSGNRLEFIAGFGTAGLLLQGGWGLPVPGTSLWGLLPTRARGLSAGRNHSTIYSEAQDTCHLPSCVQQRLGQVKQTYWHV